MREKQTIFRYQGYEMRSYSETRWASFLDSLRIHWLYEPHKIKTQLGGYMPDFYLPAVGAYLEIKGPAPTKDEIIKACDVERHKGTPVIFAYGTPELDQGQIIGGRLSHYFHDRWYYINTSEVGDIIKDYLGLKIHQEFLMAGRRKFSIGLTTASNYMDEWLASMMNRDNKETYLAEAHRPLNYAKENQHRQHSRSEWALAKFIFKMNVKMSTSEK